MGEYDYVLLFFYIVYVHLYSKRNIRITTYTQHERGNNNENAVCMCYV